MLYPALNPNYSHIEGKRLPFDSVSRHNLTITFEKDTPCITATGKVNRITFRIHPRQIPNQPITGVHIDRQGFPWWVTKDHRKPKTRRIP